MNKEQLEEEALEIIGTLSPPYGQGAKRLEDLDLAQLHKVLAYHMWKDGMEWDDVLELLAMENPGFHDKQSIMDYLVNIFGY